MPFYYTKAEKERALKAISSAKKIYFITLYKTPRNKKYLMAFIIKDNEVQDVTKEVAALLNAVYRPPILKVSGNINSEILHGVKAVFLPSIWEKD